jgi:hypothetical protein
MSGIFFCYRRDDSAGYAGRLYDDLSERLGKDKLFRDIDTIEPGVDYRKVINEAVNTCNVLIAVIGRNWLISIDAEGKRRLQDPRDFVRLEIKAALERGIRVIPVLVGGAAMPSAEEEAVPEDLVEIVYRQSYEISDSRWGYDVERLIEFLKRDLGRARPQASQPGMAPTQSSVEKKGNKEFGHFILYGKRNATSIRGFFTITLPMICAILLIVLGEVLIFISIIDYRDREAGAVFAAGVICSAIGIGLLILQVRDYASREEEPHK